MTRLKWCIILALLCGCGRTDPPDAKPDPRSLKMRARARLREAIRLYALAGATPDKAAACLPELEAIASDARYPELAARARFTIAHAYGYALKDTPKAVENFEKVIELGPSNSLSRLAQDQIENLKLLNKAGAP